MDLDQHLPQNQNPIRRLINRFNDNMSTTKIIPKNTQDCLKDGTDIDYQDTERFKFPITGGRVINVYDADTILVAFKLPYEQSPIYRINMRFDEIYTPKTFGKDVTIDEQYICKKVHCFISTLLLNKYIKLFDIRTDKHDNYFAKVYIDNVSLNDILIKKRYAVTYEGDKKTLPSSWSRYIITGEL